LNTPLMIDFSPAYALIMISLYVSRSTFLTKQSKL
jgi:hypothetical protein